MVGFRGGDKWSLQPAQCAGLVSAPDGALYWWHKERDSACDMMLTVTLTLSIKDVDRACVMKPKESKYMGL